MSQLGQLSLQILCGGHFKVLNTLKTYLISAVKKLYKISVSSHFLIELFSLILLFEIHYPYHSHILLHFWKKSSYIRIGNLTKVNSTKKGQIKNTPIIQISVQFTLIIWQLFFFSRFKDLRHCCFFHRQQKSEYLVFNFLFQNAFLEKKTSVDKRKKNKTRTVPFNLSICNLSSHRFKNNLLLQRSKFLYLES